MAISKSLPPSCRRLFWVGPGVGTEMRENFYALEVNLLADGNDFEVKLW